MEGKAPRWVPRTRAMRGACLLAAAVIAAGAALAAVSGVPVLTIVLLGVAAGFLLCIATWPGDRG